jgi:uncharacterized membrane protein YeiB
VHSLCSATAARGWRCTSCGTPSAAVAGATDGGSASSAWWSDTVGELTDTTPAQWLLVAASHSQTTFSIIGNTGGGLVVVAAYLAVAGRAPRLTVLATPVAAVGKMALTAYVLHIVADRAFFDTEDEGISALPVLLAFIATAMLLATVWTRLIRRGPLEYLLHIATRPARHIP